MTKWNRDLGLTLLGIWLVLQALLPLLGINFNGLDVLLAVVAIAAGVVILLGAFNVGGVLHARRTVGFILLAIWLILTGLIALINLTFPGLDIIMAIGAIGAGILILIGR